MWLLAIVLTATITFVSCGDDKDNPDVEKGKVEVNPEKVFVNGMPKVMDGYVFTRDFKGRLSSMYNKKEKGSVTFDYNNNTVGTTKDGYKRLSTIIYDGGNAVETVTKSEKDGKETDHYKIYYTSKKITLPIANKGCLMAFDGVLGVDLDHLQYAYFAGMLGKATKHLPIYNMDKDNDKTTFDWTFNDDGFPTKIVIKSEDERENSNIVW